MAFVSKHLAVLDDRLVDSKANDVLSLRGVGVLAAGAACGCWAARLMLRDVIAGFEWFRALSHGKQLVVELYALGTLHAAGWTWFSTRKLLRGEWDNPSGSTRALSLSIGYYLHELIVLRSLAARDPLLLIHHACELLAHASLLRSSHTQWLVPTLMSQVAPMVPLNILRIFHVVGVHAGTAIVRAMLVLYVGLSVLTSGVGVPVACAWHWVLQPKREFQQPNYLMAKVCLPLRLAISNWWFAHTLRDAPQVLQVAGSNLSLHQLRETAMQSLGTLAATSQLMSSLSLYAVVPASVPLIVSALRRGMRRLALLYLTGLAAVSVAPLPRRASRRFVDFVGSWGLSRAGDYFGFKVVKEEPIRKDKRYFMAVFPHGIMPIGNFLANRQLWEDGFLPNFLGASILFQLPVLRQLFSAMGGLPASKKNLKDCLQRDFPHNITMLVPGGIGEMFLARPDVEHILSDHMGFVKIAMEMGVDLVPVYILGQTQTFRSVSRDSTIGRLTEVFSRWARTSIPLFHGRWGTPMTFSIPYPTPMVALIGRPIPVGDPISKPSDAAVKELHSRFFEELAALFHRHKGLCPGYERKELYMGSNAAVPAPPTAEIEEFTLSRL